MSSAIANLMMKNTGQTVKAMSKVSRDDREEFIAKYGIEMPMPGNYVYKTIFYAPDPEYIVTSNFLVLPKGLTFHDYDKFIREQPSDRGHFQET
jgi:hypothetical protein